MPKLFCIPSENWSTLKGNTLLPKYFPFRVNPFSEGDPCSEKQTGSHKSYPSFVKRAKNVSSVSSALKAICYATPLYTDHGPFRIV